LQEQQALESKLSEVDSSGKSQVSELMGTLKNVKEKLKEKEVYRKITSTWIRDLTVKQKYCKKI